MVRVRVGSGWPAQNTGWVTSQPVFILIKKKKKIRFGLSIFESGWVGSENFDSFCHVYLTWLKTTVFTMIVAWIPLTQ